jgi:hypothetical protein
MKEERKIRILKNALDTILSEAKEPIIKVYAKSALDETVDEIVKVDSDTVHCHKHKWYGLKGENCPECPESQLSEGGEEKKWTDEDMIQFCEMCGDYLENGGFGKTVEGLLSDYKSKSKP